MCFAIYLFIFFDIGCPIYKLTGWPCPACGTTRALFSLLKPNFKEYLKYNAMALPLLSVFLIIITDLIKRKRFVIYSLIVAAINTVYYIIRFF